MNVARYRLPGLGRVDASRIERTLVLTWLFYGEREEMHGELKYAWFEKRKRKEEINSKR